MPFRSLPRDRFLIVVVALGAVSCWAPPRSLPPGPTIAPAIQEHHGDVAGAQEVEPDERAGHMAHSDAGHSEHGRGTQAVNLFIGGVDELGREDGTAFGVDYEYRLSGEWGVGGFAEGVSGTDRSAATGLQAYWHIGQLVLVAGPGLERRDSEWDPLLRLGGFYEFPLRTGFVLSPGIFYDFVSGDDFVVYGINIGKIW